MLNIAYDEQCRSCGGTGLYAGTAERDGYSVVCQTCDGTGCHKVRFEYTPFRERLIPTQNVRTVLEINPGICVGDGEGHDFGGMPFADWWEGEPFPAGREMRQFTCPAWWHQSSRLGDKPEWDECQGCGSFDRCPSFQNKELCWKRYDEEQS